MSNALQDYKNQKSKPQPQGMNPLQSMYQGMHNFGQGVDNTINGLGNTLYQGIHNFGQGVDNTINAIPIPTFQDIGNALMSNTLNPQAMHSNLLATQPSPTPNPLAASRVLGAQATPMPSPTMQQETPTPTPMAMIPGIDPQVSKNMTDLLNNHIFSVTRQYGIPDAVVAGQMAQESGYSAKPVQQNNYFGLKANSYPGFAHFNTPEDGARYYAQTVRALVPNLDQIKNNPLAVLQALQGHGKTGNYEGDNADPMQYVIDVSKNNAWKAFGQQPFNR